MTLIPEKNKINEYYHKLSVLIIKMIILDHFYYIGNSFIFLDNKCHGYNINTLSEYIKKFGCNIKFIKSNNLYFDSYQFYIDHEKFISLVMLIEDM